MQKPWRDLSALTDTELDFLKAEVSRADLPAGEVLCAGVYRGGDVIEIYKALKVQNKKRHIVIVDSFNGLAEPQWEDTDGTQDPMKKGECSCLGIGPFVDAMDLHGVKDYELFIQWIDAETVRRMDARNLALVWLDLDHYGPTLACMERFWPWLQPGGMMLTHDYGFERCPGIKRAADQISSEWQHMAGGIYGLRKGGQSCGL